MNHSKDAHQILGDEKSVVPILACIDYDLVAGSSEIYDDIYDNMDNPLSISDEHRVFLHTLNDDKLADCLFMIYYLRNKLYKVNLLKINEHNTKNKENYIKFCDAYRDKKIERSTKISELIRNCSKDVASKEREIRKAHKCTSCNLDSKAREELKCFSDNRNNVVTVEMEKLYEETAVYVSEYFKVFTKQAEESMEEACRRIVENSDRYGILVKKLVTEYYELLSIYDDVNKSKINEVFESITVDLKVKSADTNLNLESLQQYMKSLDDIL
jgi:hypothetical protein